MHLRNSALLLTAGMILGHAVAEDGSQPTPVPIPATQPKLMAVLPAGVQQGQTVEVTVRGRSLNPVTGVSVDGRGVTAELIPLSEGSRPNASAVRVKITAAADADPGIHELRVITPGGTSNVTRFAVGMLPEIMESEPNDDDGTSTKLTSLPVTVNGALDRGEDRDCYRFSAKKGQIIVLDLCAQQLHPYIDSLRPGWMEGVLTVRDASVISPLADENLVAQSQLKESTLASQRAAAVAKSRSEAVQKANTERNAAATTVTEKTAAAKLAAESAKQAQVAVQNADIELKAARQNAETVAASETGATDQPEADRIVAEKTELAEKARQTAEQAKAAADKAIAEQKAAEKKLTVLTETATAANNRLATAKEQSKTAGQRLAEARTRSADAIAAVNEVTSPSVRNLAVVSRTAGRYDPVLTFTVPHDGDFLVEVRDDLYRGRTEFTYRLTVGELPYIHAVFPAGVQQGTSAELKLDGVNLADMASMKIDLSADASPDSHAFRYVSTSAGTSNLVSIVSGSLPELVEAEPNDTAEQASVVNLPATLNGVIEKDGDFDSYRFVAHKGQRLVFETVSRIFGSPLDARLDLYDSRGRRVKNSDDEDRMPDSRIDYTFPADGEYVIRIGDTTSLGSSAHVYRLHIREPQPDFRLTVHPDNPRVTAGGSVAISVMIERRDGFKEDVEVSVVDPPAGATISPAVINNGQNQVTLSLTMPADAEPGQLPLTIQGRTIADEEAVVHQASPVERMRYINEWRYLPVADLQISVLPAAPFTLEWTQPELSIESGKNLDVPLRLTRTAGFSDAVRITLQGLPSRLNAPVVTFDKDATEAVVQIRAASNAPAGTGNGVATGTVRGFAQQSPALAITVVAPEKKK